MDRFLVRGVAARPVSTLTYNEQAQVAAALKLIHAEFRL